MNTICPRCAARGKTWVGSDPKCAFESGVFSADNWNCATINELRNLGDDSPVRYALDYKAVMFVRSDGYGHVVLAWYKDRGKCDIAVDLNAGVLTQLSLEEAERLIKKEEQRRGLQ